MNLKQFLKPDWRKKEIFILLFIISALIRTNLSSNYEAKYHLFPVGFGKPFIFCYLYPIVELAPEIRFNFLGLIGNIIFWYFISCLIIWIYDKFKKKPQ